MSKNTGTVVSDAIVPFGTNPTHYADFGQGGRKTVANLTALNAIASGDTLDADGMSSGFRQVGMEVWVEAVKKAFTLNIPGFTTLSNAAKLTALQSNAYWLEATSSTVVEQSLASNSTTSVPSVAAVAAVAATVTSTATGLAAKVDKVAGKQLSTEDYTSAEKTKLAGLSNADVTKTYVDNQDAALQSQITVNTTAIATKVDKVNGFGLSSNDYTSTEKAKLAGLSNADVTKAYVDAADASLQSQLSVLQAVAGTDLYNVPQAIREAVVLGAYNDSSELTQVVSGSAAGMKFSYRSYEYEHLPGDSGSLVWVRNFKKGSVSTTLNTSTAAQNSLSPASSTAAPTVDAVNGGFTTAQTNLNTQITRLDTLTTTTSGKADKSYVDAQDAALQTNINAKAATSYVNTQDAALQTDINTRALKTYVDSQDAGLQSQITTNTSTIASNTTAIATKAGKTYVDAQDGGLQAQITSNGTAIASNTAAITSNTTAIATKEDAFARGTTNQYLRGDKVFVYLDPYALGLGEVDNTSDVNKPISTATQTALNTKENTIAAGTSAQYWRGDKTFQTLDKTAVGLGNVDNVSDVNKPVSSATSTALNLKAPLASPTFTGTVTLPSGSVGVTQTAGNNTTALATTAFVTTQAATKANTLSPTFTGTPAAPTQTAGNNTTALATTAFVTAATNLKANLASPTFSGTVTLPSGTAAPTQTAGNNTTALATTAFVTTAVEAVRTTITASSTVATNYTVTPADTGNVVPFSAGVTCTIPAGGFPLGAVIEILQEGTGQVTIVAGSGVTLRYFGGVKTAGQWASIGLRQRAGNEWVITNGIA